MISRAFEDESIRKPPEKVRRLSMARYSAVMGFLFILPWILGFLFFKLIPILAALGFSFTNFDMIQPQATRFIGLANYIQFFKDRNAGASLFGSIGYFILTVPIEMIVALLLAVLFTSARMHTKGVLRTLFFMPSIIPAISIFFIVGGLLTPGSGWIDRLAAYFLHTDVSNVSSGLFAIFPVIFALWTIGPGFLIMLAAMQSVPPEVYEAARVDGAGPINRLFSITLPMISPAIFFSLVINMISSFGGVALLDRGLTYSQSLTPMEGYIGAVMFTGQDLGYASALAWVMFIVVMLITLAIFRSARYWVYFPEEEENEDF